MYAACLQAYFLTIDTETTTQITTAPTMKQAEEVMAPIRTAITRAPGPLFQFLTQGSLQNTTGNRNKVMNGKVNGNSKNHRNGHTIKDADGEPFEEKVVEAVEVEEVDIEEVKEEISKVAATDDPVRMYLMQMGQIPLLSRAE